jgi:hypothetical protein
MEKKSFYFTEAKDVDILIAGSLTMIGAYGYANINKICPVRYNQ